MTVHFTVLCFRGRYIKLHGLIHSDHRSCHLWNDPAIIPCRGKHLLLQKKLNHMEKGLKSLFLNFFSPWELFRIMVYLSICSVRRSLELPSDRNEQIETIDSGFILITGLNKLPLLFQCVVKIHKTHLARTEYLLVFYYVICLTQHSYIICISLHVYCPSGFVVQPFDPMTSWLPIPKRLFFLLLEHLF